MLTAQAAVCQLTGAAHGDGQLLVAVSAVGPHPAQRVGHLATLESQTNVREDYVKFYNHRESPY